jgi:pimeloyl-ACP methyl ester carboxylesterase
MVNKQARNISPTGLTRTSRDFDRLAKELASHFRVICPDIVCNLRFSISQRQAGRGFSDRLSDSRFYAVPQYAQDCLKLLDTLGECEVSWIGTSMGGLIGMNLAGQLDNAKRGLHRSHTWHILHVPHTNNLVGTHESNFFPS